MKNVKVILPQLISLYSYCGGYFLYGFKLLESSTKKRHENALFHAVKVYFDSVLQIIGIEMTFFMPIPGHARKNLSQESLDDLLLCFLLAKT